MRPATNLLTKNLNSLSTNRINFHFGPVFRFKQTNRPSLFSLLHSHFLTRNRQASFNLLIHNFLNLSQLLRRHFLLMNKIKSQSLRSNIRPPLRNMISQNLPQSLMQQMSCGMQPSYDLTVVREPAREFMFSTSTRFFLMFFQTRIVFFPKFISIQLISQRRILANLLQRHFRRKTISFIHIKSLLSTHTLRRISFFELTKPLLQSFPKLLFLQSHFLKNPLLIIE